MMSMLIQDIAAYVQGRLIGSEDLTVENALPLTDARGGHLTLLDDLKSVEALKASPAAAAIVPLAQADAIAQQSGKTVIGVSDIHASFIASIELLRGLKEISYHGIDQRAVIHPTAKLGDDVYVGPGAIIGSACHIGHRCRIHAGVHIMKGSRIGDDCEIFPGVVIYPETIVGARVMLHSHVVLGAYGFGYRMREGRHVRTAQLGWVEIADDVEIGAGTTIDRGTYGPTKIGEGTKIDNLVQIGHNNHLGKHNLLCSQVGIAGSCSTGDYVVFGGQAGVRDHVHLADRVMLSAQSGVANDIAEGETVLGCPALPHRESAQIFFASKRLPEMRKEIRELRGLIQQLQSQIEAKSSSLSVRAA